MKGKFQASDSNKIISLHKGFHFNIKDLELHITLYNIDSDINSNNFLKKFVKRIILYKDNVNILMYPYDDLIGDIRMEEDKRLNSKTFITDIKFSGTFKTFKLKIEDNNNMKGSHIILYYNNVYDTNNTYCDVI